MADWSNAQRGLVSGFQVGQATGGRLSNLGSIIAKVADRLRSQRETGEEMGRAMNILGVKGLVEGTIEPTKEGGFELPGVGRVKRKGGVLENVTISPEGELAYKVGDTFIPLKSVSKGGFTTTTPPKVETESNQFEENIKMKLSRGEQLVPEEINYYNKFMWRTGEEMKMPKVSVPKKDKFGFTLGQTYKSYKYIGNNQWQK